MTGKSVNVGLLTDPDHPANREAGELEKHVEHQRQAFATERPCTLLDYHAPRPVMTEHHHSKPVFLQNRVYGKIVYGADMWLCSNCHDAVHAWIYWLLRERKEPPYIGRAAKAEAQRTFEWYTAAMAEREGS